VIGSDLTYFSGSWKILSETISTILKPGGLFVYVTLAHSGFNSSGEIAGFMSVAQGDGLYEVPSRDDNAFSKIGLSSIIQSSEELRLLQSTGGGRLLILAKK